MASLFDQVKEKRNCPENLSYEEIRPFYQGHIHTHIGSNCILKQLSRGSVAIVIIQMCAQNPGGSPGYAGDRQENTPGSDISLEDELSMELLSSGFRAGP